MASSNYRTEPKKGPLMRISYAFGLRKPRENDKGVAKYGATLILPKSDTAGVSLLRSMIAECVKGQWSESGIERFKKELIKNPLIDGGSKAGRDKDTGEFRAGMGDDVWFIRPTSNDPIKAFNKDVQPASDEELVSGHWGYPVLNCFAWHHPTNGDGVSFGMSMFQFVKADEVLGGGGGGDPDKFFEQIRTEDDDHAPVGDGGAADMFG